MTKYKLLLRVHFHMLGHIFTTKFDIPTDLLPKTSADQPASTSTRISFDLASHVPGTCFREEAHGRAEIGTSVKKKTRHSDNEESLHTVLSFNLKIMSEN